jgi:hypothetical protein
MPPKNNNNKPQQQQQQGGRHTILLMQPKPDTATRTYADFNSVTEAIHGIISIFEDKKKAEAKAAGRRDAEYTSTQLLAFFDGMHDMSMLCYDKGTKGYVPYDRKFIKDKVYAVLSKA